MKIWHRDIVRQLIPQIHSWWFSGSFEQQFYRTSKEKNWNWVIFFSLPHRLLRSKKTGKIPKMSKLEICQEKTERNVLKKKNGGKLFKNNISNSPLWRDHFPMQLKKSHLVTVVVIKSVWILDLETGSRGSKGVRGKRQSARVRF